MNRPQTASPPTAETGRRPRRAESLLALVILLAPAVIALLWHLGNGAWPQDDAANYMDTAYRHYQWLTDYGFSDGLYSIYWNRGWRPVLFPVLAVPFLWATGGDVLVAAAGVLIGCLLARTAYAYGIARQYLAPLPASIAAALASTSLALLGMTVLFYSEALWLAACAAFIYHALRSGDFRNRWHAFGAGVALGIAALTRPAETAAVMGLPMVLLLAFAVRRKAIGGRDLFMAVLVMAVTMATLAAAALRPHPDPDGTWPITTALILAGVHLMLRQRLAGSTGLALCTAVVVMLNAWWWADFMPQLTSWIYMTSFGTMAKVTDVRAAQLGFAGLLGWLAQRAVSPQMILLGAMGVVIAAANRIGRRRDTPEGRPHQPMLPIALAALLPMLALYGLTGTSDPRRLLGGVFLTTLALAIIAMADGPLRKSRHALVAVAAAVQLAFFLAITRADTTAMQSLFRFVSFLPKISDTPPVPQRQPDANPDFVRRLLDAGIPRRSVVAVYTMAPPNRNARVWEPASAMLASRVLRTRLSLVYTWEIGDYEKALAFYRASDVRYLVIEAFRDRKNTASHQPYIRFATALLDRIEAGAVNPPGLEFLSRFELGGRFNYVYRIAP